MPYQEDPLKRAADRHLSDPPRVFNANRTLAHPTLAPASQGPAIAVAAGWEPLAAAYRERWDTEELCDDLEDRRH